MHSTALGALKTAVTYPLAPRIPNSVGGRLRVAGCYWDVCVVVCFISIKMKWLHYNLSIPPEPPVLGSSKGHIRI